MQGLELNHVSKSTPHPPTHTPIPPPTPPSPAVSMMAIFQCTFVESPVHETTSSIIWFYYMINHNNIAIMLSKVIDMVKQAILLERVLSVEVWLYQGYFMTILCNLKSEIQAMCMYLHIYVDTTFTEATTLLTISIQHHGHWWPDDERSQGSCSRDI